MLGTVCVCAQPPRDGMSQEDTGRTASSSSSFLKKEPMVLRDLFRMGPSIRPYGEHLLLLVQKEPACEPDSEAVNSFVGDGFSDPRVEGRK